jgi:hypothetical protein
MKNDDSAEIGVRGDCVYGIYSTPDEEKVCQVFEIAYNVNTLMILLNRHYRSKHYPEIKIGIGLATAEDLVVKTAAKGTGISAKVWIGEAVTTASNLSKYGNKERIKPIVMSDRFYRTLSKRLQRYGLTGHDFSQKTFDGLHTYHCDITNAEFEKWISENVRKLVNGSERHIGKGPCEDYRVREQLRQQGLYCLGDRSYLSIPDPGSESFRVCGSLPFGGHGCSSDCDLVAGSICDTLGKRTVCLIRFIARQGRSP